MAKNKNRENRQSNVKQQTAVGVTTDGGFSPWMPALLLAAVFAVWSYFVIRNYFIQNPVVLQNLSILLSADRFPQGSPASFWGAILDDVVSMGIVFMMLLGAFGAGDLIREALFADKEVPPVITTGVGIAASIMTVLVIGIAGLLYTTVLYALYLPAAVLGILRWRTLTIKPELKEQTNKSQKGFFTVLYVLLIFAASLTALFGALPPETFYDTLMYHLGVPLQWLQEHRIHNVHSIMQSYYPLNSHVLYAATLLLKDEKSAKLLNWAFAMLTAWAAYSFGKKYFSAASGIFAGAIFLATPMVLLVASRACIELPLAFFETLAFFSFVNWYDSSRPKSGLPPAENNKWFYLSAVFIGMAMGSKYTSASALISLIFLLAVIFLIEKKPFGKLIKKSMLYLFIVFAVMSPWFIKNYFDVGNPIYPFKLSTSRGVAQISKGKAVDYIDQAPKLNSPLHFITVPWRVAMTNEFQESHSGAAFLYLVPLLFLFKNNSKYAKLFIIYAIPYYLIWVIMGRVYFRFLIPFLPVIAVLFGYYIAESCIPKWLRGGVLFVCAVFLSSNLYFTLTVQGICQDPVGVLTGRQDKKTYLSIQRPTYPCPYYQVIDWANKNLPPSVKILSIGETRGYYSKRKIITSSAADTNPVIEWCRQSRNADELYGKIKEKGVTHILINVPEAKRLAGYDMFSFESNELKIFIEFWNKYVKEIYRDIADVTFTNQSRLGYGRFGSTVPEFWNGYIKDPGNYVYLYEILPDNEKPVRHIAPLNFLLLKDLYVAERYNKLAPIISAALSGRSK
jgi:hypothetical protein